MLLSFATLALLTLYIGLGIGGGLLFRQGGGWRIVGILLIAQAFLAFAAQVTLSMLPFGIGEPLIRVPLQELVLQMLIIVSAISLITLLVIAGIRFSARLQKPVQRRTAITGLLILLPLIASASMFGMVQASLPERERERDPSKREIVLHPDFSWSIYAQGTMDNPTSITFGPEGELYIADIDGNLWIARDDNNDYVVDSITEWASGFNLLVGVAWFEDELYTASSGKIEALRDTDGDDVADQRRLIVDELPSLLLRPHSNNGIVFGPDNRLYFGVGSTTNGEFETQELAATVLSVNPDGSDLRVFARGFGNTFDVAFNQDGELFGGDNSPMGGDGAELPDEFNHIVEGQHYGYPYFYGDQPENGGTRAPLTSFPAHSAPTGLTFYSGDQYPPEYRDNAFVTLWNNGQIERVEVAQTAGGAYLSRTTTFGSGFLYPIDAVTGPDGNLYIADFGTSAIYRITHNDSPLGGG